MKIFIIGYMASGKTTFGRALAGELQVPFIDLDEFIEERSGKKITEIFMESGEEGFRKIEAQCLREAVEKEENMVLACGGGTPCQMENMEFLNKNGITVFVETSIPVIIRRLGEDSDNRPLIAGKDEEGIRETVLSQLCNRLPRYMESKLKWHGDDLENENEIKANVETFISSYPSLFR